jgi:hypothetical protein
MIRDINGFNGFGLPFADNKFSGILVSQTEQTVTVPNSPYATYPNILAIFSFAPGSSIWVSLNATSTPPSGSIGTVTSELNPTARSMQGGDVLHFNTNDASDEMGVIFYAY